VIEKGGEGGKRWSRIAKSHSFADELLWRCLWILPPNYMLEKVSSNMAKELTEAPARFDCFPKREKIFE
jgi:hypothetical protein